MLAMDQPIEYSFPKIFPIIAFVDEFVQVNKPNIQQG